MDIYFFTIVIVGAFTGGFVNGLTGFGTGITALGLWLYVLSPSVAATLVIICSLAAQLQTLPRIWHAISLRQVTPFIVPGLIGVPIGTKLLSSVAVRFFKLSIASVLVCYSVYSLLQGNKSGVSWGGRIADGIIGFGGGMLGGLAGLSGPLPTIWSDVRGWAKEEKRSILQTFNISILLAALFSHFLSGLFVRDVLIASAIALPGTFFGAYLEPAELKLKRKYAHAR